MPKLELTRADIASHRADLVDLNVEYLTWVFEGIEDLFGLDAHQIVGVSVRDYVVSVIDKVCGDPPPRGVFYLARVDGQLAGMGVLRHLRPGVAEIKRIYCRPGFRGLKLGQRLLDQVLEDARSFGYGSVCLDTAQFMTAAHRLYESNGFSDCPAYDGVEVPPEFHSRWRFMGRAL